MINLLHSVVYIQIIFDVSIEALGLFLFCTFVFSAGVFWIFLKFM